MLHRSYPILTRFGVWIVAPVAIALIAAYGYLAQSLPVTDGSLRVRGLDSTVTVVRDEHAVPHVYASTDRDAFFAIGYLHAQERLWQMDYQRRLGQGRLSEVFGRDRLKMDQYMRTLGLYRAARLAVRALDEPSRESLSAYVAGVNAWMEEGNTLPLEYHIVGSTPEPWRAEDSLLQIKLMALDMDFNYREELLFDLLVKQLGTDKAVQLMPNYSQAERPAYSRMPVNDVIAAGLIARGVAAPRFSMDGGRLGSNAWVLAGRLTQSGYPMLANDPHLKTEIPSAWYLADLQGERLSVAGATYPGVPFVILGRNELIAWGATSLGADVQDLYMERTDPADEDRYEVDGVWTAMEVENEWIVVRLDFPTFLNEPIPPLKWTVRRTRHGPLISDAIERVATPLALRWTALDPDDTTYQSFFALNYAQDWGAFKRALRGYVAPTMNFLYADKAGNIAQISAGKVPIRKSGEGRTPVTGWDSSYEWVDYIAPEALPQSLNPEAGYIVSANNENHGADYPHLISNSWAPAYRARRIAQAIEDALEAGQKLTLEDLVRIQGDQKSLQAQSLLEFVRALTPRNAAQGRALQQLATWDGVAEEDSAGAALFQSWFRHFNRLIVNDELTGDLLRPERLDALQLFAERLNPVFVQRVVANTGDGSYDWCDQVGTARVETCGEIALQALDRAADELITLTGAERKWGEIHETYYSHRGFADVQLLDHIFDRAVASGGDGYSVNVGGWQYTKDAGYRQSLGPTYRQVVDLANWEASRFMNSTGQSGNLLSKHYDDAVLGHKHLQHLPMRLDAPKEAAHASTLLLEPASGEGDDR